MSSTTYVATEDIFAAPGVRAFRKGDVVPSDIAALPEVKDKVASSSTKAAQEAVKEVAKEVKGA